MQRFMKDGLHKVATFVCTILLACNSI